MENRFSGARNIVTKRAADLLPPSFRIVETVKPETNPQKVIKQPDFKQEENLTQLQKLQKQYHELFGKPPHHRLGEPKLKELISAKLSEPKA